MLKVSSGIQKKLLGMQESGMGFQVVNATFQDNRIRECIIINATLAEPVDDRSVQRVLAAMKEEYSEVFYKFAEPSTEIIDVRLKKDMGIFRTKTSLMLEEFGESKSAVNAPEGYTKINERFIRFSHFEDDKRIDKVNKCLLPGTYATTFDDATYCINNKIDPAERYALPNTLTINYAFHVLPSERTPIKRGIVEPANGQPGGGEEALFTKGTSHNTVVRKDRV